MSKQNKLRNKAQARRIAKASSHKGPQGASGKPHRQQAPPWVRNGKRLPKAVRERQAKMKAEQEATEREAAKLAQREVAHEL